jgi:archaetidylinositol phosphate synthase
MLSRFKPIVAEISYPIARILARVGVKPNHLTLLGLFFGLFAAFYISSGKILQGAFFVFLSSVCDMLDGAVARTQNMTSSFGGFLDSVTDRYVDVLIFVSLGIYGIDWLAVTIALTGALLVSYTRARAECIVERCDVGFAERSERLLIIFAGLITGYIYEAVIVIAVLSHITALHRVVYTKKLLDQKK